MGRSLRLRELLGALALVWGAALLALSALDSAAYGRFVASLWFR